MKGHSVPQTALESWLLTVEFGHLVGWRHSEHTFSPVGSPGDDQDGSPLKSAAQNPESAGPLALDEPNPVAPEAAHATAPAWRPDLLPVLSGLKSHEAIAWRGR